MAKIENESFKDIDPHILEELDRIAEGSLPNRGEIVTLTSKKKFNQQISITRDQVYRYASVMSSTNTIADLLGIEKETLQKHFSNELKMARAFARQKLITRFYHLALYGTNPADRLFALKNWANMSDSGMTEPIDEIEDGVEFKVKRPQKVAVTQNFQDARNDYLDNNELAKENTPEESANEES